MNILIDSGSYHSLNMGDVAMMQAAIGRLRDRWASATIRVITNAPAALALHCSDVYPVPLAGRVAFLTDRFAGRVSRLLPRALRHAVDAVEEIVRRHWPSILASTIAAKYATLGRSAAAAARQYVEAVLEADLLIISGAGLFTDAFVERAAEVLSTIELARLGHIPAAAFGQGIGPVDNRILRGRMREVFPLLGLIGLREGRRGAPLLRDLGVDAARIMVTGDDAIEMAHGRRRAALGDGLGLNVRVAAYAGVATVWLETIREAVCRAAIRHGAPLVPVPIARHEDCSDSDAIRRVVDGDGSRSTGGVELDTPAKVMDAVSACRIVVTGSYHAAVFALAQGIQVIGLAATPYYLDKFSGLADLFPGGCDIVRLDAPWAGAHLRRTIDRAWAVAADRRDRLLAAARDQIGRSRAAYARLFELVG